MIEIQSKITTFFKSLFSAFGVLWLFIQFSTFISGEEYKKQLESIWWLFLVLGTLHALYEIRPKNKVTFKIPSKDTRVKIFKGNIFNLKKSAIIIPINNQFKVDNDGRLLTAKSILAQVVKKYFKHEPNTLEKLIHHELPDKSYKTTWAIGTVIPVIYEGKTFYFLANSELNKDNRAQCNDKMLQESLKGLWEFLSKSSKKGDLSMPIIGTGYAGIVKERELVFKDILLSFLESLSKKNYADSLTICIYPKDIKDYKIDFKQIEDLTYYHTTYN